MKIKLPLLPIITHLLMNNMTLELPNAFGFGNHKVLQLSKDNNLESLYQINDQSIWFLIWILKKMRFWSDLTKETLEAPFTVKRNYWGNGQIRFLITYKSNWFHGKHSYWWIDGKMINEYYWKDGKKQHGFTHYWCNATGQLVIEQHWKEGHQTM